MFEDELADELISLIEFKKRVIAAENLEKLLIQINKEMMIVRKRLDERDRKAIERAERIEIIRNAPLPPPTKVPSAQNKTQIFKTPIVPADRVYEEPPKPRKKSWWVRFFNWVADHGI